MDRNDSALSGLHVAVRYTLPRVVANASTFSGTVAAVYGYVQDSRQNAAREAVSSQYTCVARREPRVGVNTRTEVLCAGTSRGAVVLWRFPLPHRHGGLPPPPNTIPGPLVLGMHRAAVTSLAFYDDTVVVTGSNDCTLKLWDVHLQYISTQAPGQRDGSRCVQTLCAHDSSISHVAVHGPWVVSAGSTDGTIKVWGCAPGRDKLSFPFLVPLQVIVLDARITAMYVGELRAVEGVVPDLIVATADGNVTMLRSTEEALVATSTQLGVTASSTTSALVMGNNNNSNNSGSARKESSSASPNSHVQQHPRISVFRIIKQVRTHFPDGVIPTTDPGLQQQYTDSLTGGGGASSGRSGFFEQSSSSASPSPGNINKQLNAQQQQQQAQAQFSHGSLTSIIPLTELNTVMTLGFSSSCFARDCLYFSIMNALSHPDVNTSTAPGNPVRFVHCAYDAKKEELLLVDSLGELFVWSTKSARIVYRTHVLDGAFALMAVGERGFWLVGRRDICMIRVEREEHRLEHRAHKERIIHIELAPPREWWSMSSLTGGGGGATAVSGDSKSLQARKQAMIEELEKDDDDINNKTGSSSSRGGGGGGGGTATEELRRRRRQQAADEAAAAAADLVAHTKSQLEEITPWLVSAAVDNSICVWNSAMKCMHTMREKRSEIASFCVLWTQPGFVVSGHEDGSVKVWALTATAATAMKTPTSSIQALNSASSQAATEMLTAAAAGAGGGEQQQQQTQQQQHFVSASEAFSQDTSSNAFHFKAHSNTVSVVGEGLHRRSLYDANRFERCPHLFSASYDGTLAVWAMPCVGGSRVKCEARVKCSDSEIVSAVYDETQYCYWVGTNRGEVTAWSVDDLRPLRRLSACSSASSASYASGRSVRGGAMGRSPRVSIMADFSAFGGDDDQQQHQQQQQHHHQHGDASSKSLLESLNANNVETPRRTASRRRLRLQQQNQHLAGGGIAHSEATTSVALDANYVFTGSEDGTVRMWNGVTGEMHHALYYDKEGVKMLRKMKETRRKNSKNSSQQSFDSSSSSSGDDGEEGASSSGGTTFGDDNNNIMSLQKGARLAGDVHHMFVLPETGHIVVGTRLGVVTLFDQATGRAVAVGTTNRSQTRNAAADALLLQQELDQTQLQRDTAQLRRQQQQRRAAAAAAAGKDASLVPTLPGGGGGGGGGGGASPRSGRRASTGITSARAALFSKAAAAVAQSGGGGSSPRSGGQQPSAEMLASARGSGGGGGGGDQGGGTNDQRLSARESATTLRDKMFADDFNERISREVCSLALCRDKKELIAGLGNGSVVRLSLSALHPIGNAAKKQQQQQEGGGGGGGTVDVAKFIDSLGAES